MEEKIKELKDEFNDKLSTLLDKCDLGNDDEREFLELLAEFMVFFSNDSEAQTDPRTSFRWSYTKPSENNSDEGVRENATAVFKRSIHSLKEKKNMPLYTSLINEYQNIVREAWPKME